MGSIELFSRRAGLAALGACLLAGLAGCTPTNAPAVQAASPSASALRIRDIRVNTAPLLAQSGNPTAKWVQEALPGLIAQDFAAAMAPDDPSAATLTVRIDSIVLGTAGAGPEGGAIDNMRGVATLGGTAGGAPRKIPLRATSFFTPTSVDQTLWKQAEHGRVSELSQSFAYWLQKKLQP